MCAFMLFFKLHRVFSKKVIKCYKIPKGKSRMDISETLVALHTQDRGRRQTNKTETNKNKRQKQKKTNKQTNKNKKNTKKTAQHRTLNKSARKVWRCQRVIGFRKSKKGSRRRTPPITGVNMDVSVHDKTQTSPHVMACAVKPVYKGHSTYPENVVLNEQLPFIYRFKIYALFINGKHETVLYRH